MDPSWVGISGTSLSLTMPDVGMDPFPWLPWEKSQRICLRWQDWFKRVCVFVRLFVCSFVCLFVCWLVGWLVCLFVCLFVPTNRPHIDFVLALA